MVKNMDAVKDFADSLNSDGAIGDFNISYAFAESDNVIQVALVSNHNVYDYQRNDEYNNFAEFNKRVFSSNEWREFLKKKKSTFYGMADEISEKLSEEYHETVIEESAFVFNGDLKRMFEMFIGRNYEEDAGIDAHNVEFDIVFERIAYYPADYIIEKYDGDRKSQYNTLNKNVIENWTGKVKDKGVADNLFNVKEIYITESSVYIDLFLNKKQASKVYKSEIESFYERSDFIRYIKHPIIFANVDKLTDKYNNIFNDVVLESEEYSSLNTSLTYDLTNFADKLYQDNQITEDQYDDLYNVKVNVSLKFANYFNKEDLSYKAEQERKSVKYRKRRR